MKRVNGLVLSLFLLLSLGLFIVGCNVGIDRENNSSDSEGDPAQAELHVSPSAIDSGDRMTIDVVISEFTTKYVALKIRLPKGLTYILDSSTLTVNGTILDAGPRNDDLAGDYRYLVYYFDEDDFLPAEQGVLTLLMEGESDVAQGKVEVDIDFDDQEFDNDSEFNASDPQFDPQVEVDIRVGNASSGSNSSGSASTSSSTTSSSSSSADSSSSESSSS
ncbi:MAG: hypothetical protein IT292_02695 [Deltaproteobacteria bacterium]|nr:hypothetical protein [Deltaproteobacteria bacterium]